MNFIQLTLRDFNDRDNRPVWVDMSQVKYISRYVKLSHTVTRLTFSKDMYLYVNETPEEVLDRANHR